MTIPDVFRSIHIGKICRTMICSRRSNGIAALLLLCQAWIDLYAESFQLVPTVRHWRAIVKQPAQRRINHHQPLEAAKGFGSSTTSNSSSAKKKKKPKDIQKNLKKRYGGTTPEAIAKGTQMAMEKALQALPEHVQTAAQLYQTIRKWDVYYNRLTIVQQTSVDPAQLDRMDNARTEYAKLCEVYEDISDRTMHDLFQQLTWDASADAKAARVFMGGEMPARIKERIQTACKWAKESIGDSSICLDVGCGYGAIVPDLIEAGIRADQIYGIDLSPEMIQNAQTMWDGGSRFEVANFYEFTASDIGAVVFCSALHDMPDIPAAIHHAASLLPVSGRLIIVHAQGAQHVVSQVEANPVLVPRPLPNESELQALAKANGMQLQVVPAAASTPRDVEEGYLAVLEKVAP